MSRSSYFVGLAVAVLLVGTASLAQAQSYWNVPSGNWSAAGNWNPTGVPASTGSAVIDNNGTATIDNTDGIVNVGNLTMGDSTGNGYLQLQTGGILNGTSGTPLTEMLGVGSSGSGIFTQSGGINIPSISSATVVNLGLCSLGAAWLQSRRLRGVRHERRLVEPGRCLRGRQPSHECDHRSKPARECSRKPAAP